MFYFGIGSDSNGNTFTVQTKAEMLREVHGDMMGWTETESRRRERYIKRRKALKIQTVSRRQTKTGDRKREGAL